MRLPTFATRVGLATLAWAAALAASAAESPSVPADFKIVAHYYAGFSRWKTWETTITADGKVTQEIINRAGTKKDSRLSADELKDLVAEIEKSEFFSLKNRYDTRVVDAPTLELTVTLKTKVHEVSVQNWRGFKKNEEVKRFLAVWCEVLKKVPSPNPEQKPELYKP